MRRAVLLSNRSGQPQVPYQVDADDFDGEVDENMRGFNQGTLRTTVLPTQNYGRAPWPIRSSNPVTNARHIIEDTSILMTDEAKLQMRANIEDTSVFDDPLFHGERTSRWPARTFRRLPRINNPNMTNSPTPLVFSEDTAEINVQPPLPDRPITYGVYPYRAKHPLIIVFSGQAMRADYEQQ